MGLRINDTHLHALLQRILINLENKIMHGKRKDMWLNHGHGIPTLARYDILNIVETAWRMVDHKNVAATGYVQTGPHMPSTGPLLLDHVCRDLRTVLSEIDPPAGLEEVGSAIRDTAQAFVRAGYPAKWSCWEHVKRLIIEHDTEDDPIPEGAEAFGWEIEDDHDDDDDDDNLDDDGMDNNDDAGDEAGGTATPTAGLDDRASGEGSDDGATASASDAVVATASHATASHGGSDALLLRAADPNTSIMSVAVAREGDGF